MALRWRPAITIATLAVMGCSAHEPVSRVYGTKELTVDQPGRSDFAGLGGFEHWGPARATLLCVVTHSGLLADCKVEKFEGPQDGAVRQGLIRGFFEVAQSTRVETRARDGSDAVGQRYRVAVRLALKG
jgi:hypothetical protein